MTDDARGVPRGRPRRGTLAAVVVLALAGIALLALAPPAAADSHGNDTGHYAIEQGDQCVDVTPIVGEDQNVTEFYDYRHPNSTPSASTYSSYGTTAYQEDDTSTLLLYDGSEGTSLVFVHDKLHEPASQGTNGSSVTMTVTGIDPGDRWTVEDDDYVGQNDEFVHRDSESVMSWLWTKGRNDGGAYRGLSGDVDIGIEPAFNEAAEKRFDNTPGYSGQITDWDVVTATDDGVDRVALDSLTEQVTVRSGYCAAPPSASLDADVTAPAIGAENVTFDANGSQVAAGADEYRWDLTGNGSTDRTTEEPVLSTAFDEPGQRDVTVTVVDEHGRTDTAAIAIDPTDDAAPTARIDAPTSGTIGQDVTVSGAGSTDDDEIASYEWNFDDGTTADGETATHTFDEPRTYDVELVVADPSGNRNATTTAVNVTEPDGPIAALDAPANATVDQPVSLDASGSTVTGNVSYEWHVDGTAVSTTAEPTYEHAFSTDGTREVGVTVRGENDSDTVTTEVDVAAALNASVQANRTTATVGGPIAFDAGQSTGRIAAYEWDHDDGSSQQGDATVTHAYDEAGEYDVSLTVTDYSGDTATDAVTVSITEPEDPTAQLDAPANATTGEPVLLDARGSDAGDNESYEWSIGGTAVNATTGPTYEHVFSVNGTFDVGVTVTDDGGTDTDNATIEVATPDETDGDNGTDGGDGNETDGDDGTDGGNESDGDDGNESDGDDDNGGNPGGGSSGGGGFAPPPEPSEPVEPDLPVETSVETSDGAVVVTAEHLDAGESVDVDLSATDGPALGGAGLQSLTVVPATDADTAQITLEPASRDVPGRFVEPAAIDADASIDLQAVTYEFGVDRERLETAGVSADDLVVYAQDSGEDWRRIGTDAAVADDRVLASATVDGDESVGLGAVGPALLVGDAETDGLATNGTVEVASTVSNTGTEPGDWTVPVAADGPVVQESVTIDAGETAVVRSTVPVAGERDVSLDVAGQRREVAAIGVTDLALESTLVEPNETVVANATLRNRGSAPGEVEAELLVDGTVVASEPVALEPGEQTAVTFEHAVGTPGSYEVAVGNESASVRVAKRDSFDSDDGDDEVRSDATDGFGALAALVAVALLALAVAATYRRNR